jgi:PKD repeat protein
MQKAVTVDDILAVQTQLTNTAGQIETTKGRMQYLEQTSAMSLITVNLQQSTLTISLYAGTTYARTKDNIGFAVDIQGGISPFSYQWDFGDAAKSVEASPWHKYNASGNYRVSVTVTDDKGNKAVDSRSNYITILPGWSPMIFWMVRGGVY